MKVFLSWSGPRARKLAEGLRQWLPDVLHKVDPWLSSEDIDPGARWNVELATQLEQSHFGVICLTSESAHAPWLLFEAGALAKTLGSSRVCPYLFQMQIRDLQLPLAQFDAVEANRAGTLKLLRSINHALASEGPLPDDRLLRCFERWWPDLERILDEIPSPPSEPTYLPAGAESLGLERVFRSRSDALTHFGSVLRREIEKSRHGRGLVYFTCTSMRGFLATDAKDFHGPRLVEELIKSGCEVHIMLTHPETADRRSHQEKRPPGAIAGEVTNSVTQLRTLGVPVENIKYYRGSPTVFGIATSEAMLLNPYPYENESHRCWTVIVRKTDAPEDIYHQYFDAHFERPWSHAVPVDEVGGLITSEVETSRANLAMQPTGSAGG